MRQMINGPGLSTALLFLFAAFISVAPGQAGAAGEGGRNPFSVPHNHAGAVRMLALKGVVRTEHFKGAIVQVGDGDNVSVFRVGDRVRLELDDHVYEFSVAAIKEKSVVFKSRDGNRYEVVIR